MSPALVEAMGLNLTVLNHPITLSQEILVMFIAAIIFVALATFSFNRAEA